MKADETLKDVPVIMISALTELDGLVRCIEMGAEDYLPKPFEPTLLQARISSSLEKKWTHEREMWLHAELQDSYRRLQEVEKGRDDLANMIVHDLRTPLSSVISGMQTVKLMGDLGPSQQEALDIALYGGETLLEMINALLDVDKMESGSLELDCTLLDANELIRSAVSQVAPLMESKNLQLVERIDDDAPAFLGDEHMLQRTLVNLLGNAVKFTPSGGTVAVGLQTSADRQSVVFSVCDTGEGIPADAFEKVFEKFGQVRPSKGGQVASTGLGLTFCRLAVEAHGGRIWVESVQDEGSTFSFSLPVSGP